MGARERCAALTIWTIRASSVSAPTRSARITNAPVPFTVPPVARAPSVFSTGTGSPVIIDSSTKLEPSVTTPSTGTRSPGRTRNRSPGCTWSSGTSSSEPSAPRRRAVSGASLSKALIALLVWLRARSSSTWPSNTRQTITAAGSKYSASSQPWRSDSGKIPGATVAIKLYKYAAPAPAPISVNMFRLRFAIDAQARSKIGHPAQSTTGLASANSSHGQCAPTNIIASNTVAAGTLSQNRRNMSVYSGFTSSTDARVKLTGSNAMPHLGHEPGPICRTSGCMGQVYSTPAATGGIGLGSRYFSGPDWNLAAQPAEQK